MEDTKTLNAHKDSKVKIFISYSSKDTELMNDLLTQLKVLTISDKQIEIWEDGLLEPGLQWEDRKSVV